MKPDAQKIIRAWHRLQRERGSCVAACRAIVDARSGGEGNEEPSDPAFTAEFLYPSFTQSVDVIVAHVRQPGASAIITVVPGFWMDLARLKEMKSPYGDLGTTVHAIVIVTADSGGKMLVALDPYFPRDLQPVFVSRDDFVIAWTGWVEFVDP